MSATAEAWPTKYQKQKGQSNLGYGIWRSASCIGKAPEAFVVGQPNHHQRHHLIYVSKAVGDQAVLIPKIEWSQIKYDEGHKVLGPLV